MQNFSLNFKDQKEESLAKKRPIRASRRLVQPMFQIILATRKLVQTASLFIKRTIPTNESKWKVIPANSSDGGDLGIAVSKSGYKNGASSRPRRTTF